MIFQFIFELQREYKNLLKQPNYKNISPIWIMVLTCNSIVKSKTKIKNSMIETINRIAPTFASTVLLIELLFYFLGF